MFIYFVNETLNSPYSQFVTSADYLIIAAHASCLLVFIPYDFIVEKYPYISKTLVSCCMFLYLYAVVFLYNKVYVIYPAM